MFRKNKTNDHLPPDSFYPINSYPNRNKPRPIKLPCCSKCQTSFNKNEDYIRQRLLLCAKETNKVSELKQKLYKKIKHEKFKILNDVRISDLYANGIFINKEVAIINAFYEEIKYFTERLVRGYYYYTNNYTVLPETYGIATIPLELMTEKKFDNLIAPSEYSLPNIIIDPIILSLLCKTLEGFSIGNDPEIFVCKHTIIETIEKENIYCFLFSFYQSINILSFTIDLKNVK